LQGVSINNWSIRIDHFVAGDLSNLIRFIENFDQQDLSDRYLIINSLGDGRQFAAAPTWRKDGKSIELSCTLKNRFPRKNAKDLGRTLARDNSNDIFLVNRSLSLVSGIEALPQKIRTTLSLIQDKSPFYPKAGNCIKEYFDIFDDSPWILRWVKLEVIRQACIHY